MPEYKRLAFRIAIPVLFNFSILFCLLPLALAFEAEGISFDKGLVIHQENYKSNGVWVCRPVAFDEKISSIISGNNVNSVDEYVSWLQANIRYRKDLDGDSWSNPEETLNNRCGDCEDYAFLNQAILERVGYETRVLAMGGLGETHAICVFKEGEYYSWIDNNQLKRTQAKSILEFAKYLFTNYECCFLLTVNLKTRDWDILLKKSEVINRTM